MVSSKSRAKRFRGGKAGNLNSLKHGFYSHTFRSKERGDLEVMLAEGVEEEIALLRVYIRRVAQIAESHGQEGADPLNRAIQVMSAVGMTSLQLGSRLKVQKILGQRAATTWLRRHTDQRGVVRGAGRAVPCREDRAWTGEFGGGAGSVPQGGLPPNNAFWSLTMGDARNHFVANPINRYSFSDRSGLIPNADGSVDIYIQNAAPAGHESNWLPAPSGNFILWLLVYVPGQAILDGEYKVPPVVETQ
jgi:Protein of unknown function (DUF1214)